MLQALHGVTGFKEAGPFCLEVAFDDGSRQTIDFSPVLMGELYGPLADLQLFRGVKLDEEAQTLVWPNGADFDPAILHDWPDKGPEITVLAKGWGNQRR